MQQFARVLLYGVKNCEQAIPSRNNGIAQLQLFRIHECDEIPILRTCPNLKTC